MRKARATSIDVAVLLLFGAAVFLPNLGQEASFESREARHAEIARVMATTGEYVVPSLFGKPYIDKGPLFNWTVAGLFKLTGRVNFTIARLPSAVSAMASMLLVYVLGRRWMTVRAGMYAAGIWATSWIAVEWGHASRMDMMMTFLVLCGVVLTDIAATSQKGRRRAVLWLAACLVVGLAGLTKNLLAIAFFAPAAAAIWRVRQGRWLMPVSFAAAGLAIAVFPFAAWLAAAEYAHPGHAKALFGYQVDVGLVEHSKRVTLYIDQLVLRTMPWALFCAGGFWWAVRVFRQRGFKSEHIPALVSSVTLLVMTCVPNKRALYMLPFIPMWVLFIGGYIDWALTARSQGGQPESGGRPEPPRWAFDWAIVGVPVALVGGLAGLLTVWLAKAHEYRMPGAVALGAAFAIIVIGASAAMRGKMSVAAGCLLAGLGVTAATIYPFLIPQLFPPTEGAVEARGAAAMIPAGAPVADYGVKDEYLCFKLNRTIVFPDKPEELREFMNGPGPRYVVTGAEGARTAAALTSRTMRTIGAYNLGNSRVEVLEVGGETGANNG